MGRRQAFGGTVGKRCFSSRIWRKCRLVFFSPRRRFHRLWRAGGQRLFAAPRVKPWIALVYVDPKARGQRLSEKIVRHLEAQASQQGFAQVYLVSQHLGLYEKYGYTLLEKTDEGIHEVDYLYEKTLA
ncbi:GNAT family N-acetyltransferase [Moraxella sp. VT-16-12]|uniref:GNAT family N-acetyltransferase n=1 Tax=Moraxella sp. VT-16-12 TaxID=2014877 RepID=UPI000B7E4545|nr:GNAT family N-acetyltransferase [Moraxella sp. VT-16-12]TWV84626.1 GNAT family N-acetyltransferase [Moraxella sp. VT-16-12]